MKLKLKIWKQKDARSRGSFVTYDLDGVSPEMSFIEMLTYLNETLIAQGGEPVTFEHDCHEGICGSCGMYVNGYPHGPVKGLTTCLLSMRYFKDGETITIEPWRAKPFPGYQRSDGRPNRI